MIRAVSLRIAVGGNTLVDDLSFAAEAGTIAAITGPSGSGKTLLARVLAGVRAPDGGEVQLDGARPAFVPQDYGLLSTLTVSETVALPLQARGVAKPEIRERVGRWVAATGLEGCATRPVSELSGGQRQRVAIARALALDAPVLVMDEPTSELDPATRDRILALLDAEAKRGAVLLLVSHDPDVIERSTATIELGA